MGQVKVRIFRKGREVAQVMRPLRDIDGHPFVKYKRKLRPLVNGGEVYLDGIVPDAMVSEACASYAVKSDDADSPTKTSPPYVVEWDQSQIEVIDASPEDRLLVGAGPGTGKTAVACARVSKLINQDGLEPGRIWLISFTRTAVREIRDRIASYLDDSAAAYAVKIATLDSHAWTIHSGFDEDAQILGGYEENIERVLRLIRSDDNVADYLEGIEHLVVDEAQDIVGIRAELVIEIIQKLSSWCGVTVFADEAQAIYGFADDKEVKAGAGKEPPLPEKLRNDEGELFREHELSEVHRTDSPQLLRIFSDTRRRVLGSPNETDNKLVGVREEVTKLSHGDAPSVEELALADLEDAFILYRRRCDALLTTTMLAQNGVLHRVRMSGMPVCLAPWIGATLSTHTDPDLSQDRFTELWAQAVDRTALATCHVNEAWTHLVRIAGRTQMIVDMRLLRQRLGRGQPPAELCHSELGLEGPVVGTIHASKGREADTVHLMLPGMTDDSVDQDEEARVVFVGATRGRSKLLIGRGYRQYARRVDASGRVYCLHTKNKKPRAQYEIGRDGDICAEGLAGRRFFDNSEAVYASQERIKCFGKEMVSLTAVSDQEANFAYRLREDGKEQCLAVLSPVVNKDLFAVAKAIQAKLGGGRRRPPNVIPHLYVRGVRTVVLPPDAPEGEALFEPWRSSGIMLAPLILGYSTTYFPSSRNR